jgi:hypothetical protein
MCVSNYLMGIVHITCIGYLPRIIYILTGDAWLVSKYQTQIFQKVKKIKESGFLNR